MILPAERYIRTRFADWCGCCGEHVDEGAIVIWRGGHRGERGWITRCRACCPPGSWRPPEHLSQPAKVRLIHAQHASRCYCGYPVAVGDRVLWSLCAGIVGCAECSPHRCEPSAKPADVEVQARASDNRQAAEDGRAQYDAGVWDEGFILPDLGDR
jgi:hypothetical protein